jgi:hypothetical protein
MAGAAVLASGCVYRERTVYRTAPPGPAPGPVVATGEVEVTGPPPTEVVVESQTISPGVGFVWVPGFYAWGGGRWVWTHGYWGHPARPGVVWVGPHYVFRGGRHIWIRGGWR